MGRTMNRWGTDNGALYRPEEVAHQTGVPVEILTEGLRSGLLIGITKVVEGERRFTAPGVRFVAWTALLAEKVLDRRMSRDEFTNRIWKYRP